MFSSKDKMRVKVVFGQAKLVVPCGNTGDKVDRLIDDINRRFQAHLGDATVRAKELLTIDGFLLSANDLIDDVIENNSTVNALDFATWLKLQLPLLEKTGGHKVARVDHAEGNPRSAPSRFAEIGKHKHNKIFVKIGATATDVDKLELFDADSLRAFAGTKDGRVLIAHKSIKDDKWDWSAEVHFIVEKGVVVKAELSVKATSDARAHIETVPINIDTLTVGEAKVVQTASFGKPTKAYELPAAVREGPAFVPGKDFLPLHQEPEGIVESPVPENNVATGDIGIEIKQKDACQPDQGWRESDGFWNKFYNNLALFNPLDKEIALTKITSAYEKDGEWIPMTTSLGYKQGYYNYQFGARHDGFALGPNDRLNLAINSMVKVDAPQFDRERRAHSSLPSPLRIRISFEDKEGHSSAITIEHRNQPLYLSTKESREAQLKKPVAFFLSADDISSEANVWTQVVEVPDEKRVEVSSKGSNSTIYLTKTLLDKLLFEAKKKQTEAGGQQKQVELPMANLTSVSKEKGTAIEATALVDLENQWVFAIRFEVRTNTSRAVDHYVLPDIF